MTGRRTDPTVMPGDVAHFIDWLADLDRPGHEDERRRVTLTQISNKARDLQARFDGHEVAP